MPYYFITIKVTDSSYAGRKEWQGVRFTDVDDEGKFYTFLRKRCHEQFRTLQLDVDYRLLADDDPLTLEYLALLQWQGRQCPILFPKTGDFRRYLRKYY